MHYLFNECVVVQQVIRLYLSIAGTAALALSAITIGVAKAEETKTTEGRAADLGVMGISLKDAIKPNIGIQAGLIQSFKTGWVPAVA